MVCVIVFIYCVLCIIINYFIVLLVFVDLLVFLFFMLFRIYFILCNDYWCFDLKVCVLWFWIDLVVCSLFVGSLVVVLIERFVVVKYFLCYLVFMIWSIGLKMIVFVWLYLIICVFFGNYNWMFNRVEIFEGCGKNDLLFYMVVVSLVFFLLVGIVIIIYIYFIKIVFL